MATAGSHVKPSSQSSTNGKKEKEKKPVLDFAEMAAMLPYLQPEQLGTERAQIELFLEQHIYPFYKHTKHTNMMLKYCIPQAVFNNLGCNTSSTTHKFTRCQMWPAVIKVVNNALGNFRHRSNKWIATANQKYWLVNERRPPSYKTVWLLVQEAFEKDPNKLSDEKQDMLYWFLRECVAPVSQQWGPAALGKKRSYDGAVKGEDGANFMDKVTPSDFGYAVGAQKWHWVKWPKPAGLESKDVHAAHKFYRPPDWDDEISLDDSEPESDEEEEAKKQEKRKKMSKEALQKYLDKKYKPPALGDAHANSKITGSGFHNSCRKNAKTMMSIINGVMKKNKDDKIKLYDYKGKQIKQKEIKQRIGRVNLFMQKRLKQELEKEGHLVNSDSSAGGGPNKESKKKKAKMANIVEPFLGNPMMAQKMGHEVIKIDDSGDEAVVGGDDEDEGKDESESEVAM